VDGEIGRLTFKTYSLLVGDKGMFDTSKDIFKTLLSKEWYRTEGFNELAIGLAVDMSYRKATKHLNRMRHEEEGTPLRTLSNIIEIEGRRIQKQINVTVKNILAHNHFSYDGIPTINTTNNKYGLTEEKSKLKTEITEEAIEAYNIDKEELFRIDISQVDKFYEDSEVTTNISIDDVSVKKQKEKRDEASRKAKDDKTHYVRNTIVHIENNKGTYHLNEASTVKMMPIPIAFLLDNSCLNSYLRFFVDGEQTLHNSIIKAFSWHKSVGLILDWYHLIEKCKMQLSLASKCTEFRNETLKQIKYLLWIGKVSEAVTFLNSLDKSKIKSEAAIEKLIGYFERNNAFIPCYALRQKLGLRNSSNKAEKANGILVANRQKHQGMSWSKCGSVSLTTITTIYKNGEEFNWYKNEDIEFKLVV
jgi:hypothetical protein